MKHLKIFILILIAQNLLAGLDITNRIRGYSSFKYYQRPEIDKKSIAWITLNDRFHIWRIDINTEFYSYYSFLSPAIYQKTPGSLDGKLRYPDIYGPEKFLYLNKFYLQANLFDYLWTYLRIGNITIEQKEFNIVFYGIEPENTEGYMLPYSVLDFGMLNGLKTGGEYRNWINWNFYSVINFNDGADNFEILFNRAYRKNFKPEGIGGDFNFNYYDYLKITFAMMQYNVYPVNQYIEYDYIQSLYNTKLYYDFHLAKLSVIYSKLYNKNIKEIFRESIKKEGEYYKFNLKSDIYTFDIDATLYAPGDGYTPKYVDTFIDYDIEKRFAENEILFKLLVKKSYDNFDFGLSLYKDFQDKSDFTNNTIYRLNTKAKFFRFQIIADTQFWDIKGVYTDRKNLISNLGILLFPGMGFKMYINFRFYNDLLNKFKLYKEMRHLTIDYNLSGALKLRFEYKYTNPETYQKPDEWETYYYIDNYIRFDVVYRFNI